MDCDLKFESQKKRIAFLTVITKNFPAFSFTWSKSGISYHVLWTFSYRSSDDRNAIDENIWNPDHTTLFTEPSQICCSIQESNSRTRDPKRMYLIWHLNKLILLVFYLNAVINYFKVLQGSMLQYVHNKNNLLWSCFTGVYRIVCSAKNNNNKKSYGEAYSSSEWHTMVITYVLLGI